MGGATGNVIGGSGSTGDKAKRFLTNSIGVYDGSGSQQNGQGGNIAGFADPLELNLFTSAGEKKERFNFEQDQVVALEKKAKEAGAAADMSSANSSMISEDERRRLQLGGGRASTMLTSGDTGSTGGRRYLGSA